VVSLPARDRRASRDALPAPGQPAYPSPAAFDITLRQHERSLAASRRPRQSAVEAPAMGILRRLADRVDEECGDDVAADEATEAATRLFTELTPEEREFLK